MKKSKKKVDPKLKHHDATVSASLRTTANATLFRAQYVVAQLKPLTASSKATELRQAIDVAVSMMKIASEQVLRYKLLATKEGASGNDYSDDDDDEDDCDCGADDCDCCG